MMIYIEWEAGEDIDLDLIIDYRWILFHKKSKSNFNCELFFYFTLILCTLNTFSFSYYGLYIWIETLLLISLFMS